MTTRESQLKEFLHGPPPKQSGYSSEVIGSFGHSITMMVRQRRIVLAAFICFLPVLIPLMMAFFNSSQFADSGMETFMSLTQVLQINVLTPLLALFFATMLVGQDVESQTIPFVLTRPIHRTAWVAGRFLAYIFIVTMIMGLSILLTFFACTTLEGFALDGDNARLVTHFIGVGIMALAAYGAFTMFLGTVSKRPIVLGVVFLYGWQRLASIIPGLVDFLTIKKYVDSIMPSLALERMKDVTVNTEMGEFTKQAINISALNAIIALVIIIAGLCLLTIVGLRGKEFATAHSLGG
jgi:ABC-type transport system involved in multi-copper enzyme maturation permease subunit